MWAQAADPVLAQYREQWKGDALYGVNPVLAAIKAKRREIYKLYVQEGEDRPSPSSDHHTSIARSSHKHLLDLGCLETGWEGMGWGGGGRGGVGAWVQQ